mmetsp:Transcript_1634/g.3523  ORF Transcript_1634/g.3523 Transcript_1634/m.3523 type:complete len:253 (-) Transcript_1634:34-792(-)
MVCKIYFALKMNSSVAAQYRVMGNSLVRTSVSDGKAVQETVVEAIGADVLTWCLGEDSIFFISDEIDLDLKVNKLREIKLSNDFSIHQWDIDSSWMLNCKLARLQGELFVCAKDFDLTVLKCELSLHKAELIEYATHDTDEEEELLEVLGVGQTLHLICVGTCTQMYLVDCLDPSDLKFVIVSEHWMLNSIWLSKDDSPLLLFINDSCLFSFNPFVEHGQTASIGRLNSSTVQYAFLIESNLVYNGQVMALR